jgi:hypothetical protein
MSRITTPHVSSGVPVMSLATDREGVVRWPHHCGFDQAQADEVPEVLTALADGLRNEADHASGHRRPEP